MDNIIEKYSELKEELDGKNPFVKYKWLRWSYGMFLFGMIGSIVITITSLIII